MLHNDHCSSETRTSPVLSLRQRQVLTLIADGRTDMEIAFLLGISPRTVRMHVDVLRAKLGVARRRHLLVYRDLAKEAMS